MSDILKKQYELNRQIVLLNGKRPIYKNWQNINIDYDLADKHQGNYGWILSDEDLIIDVDLRSGGEESFKN